MEDLLVLLKKHAIDVSPEFTGEYIRNGSFWFCGKKTDCQGKIVLCARFGDWSTGKRFTWTDTKDLNPREKELFNEELKKAAEEDRIEKERRWAQVAVEVESEWASFVQEGESPYLERKGLRDLEGCRIESHENGNRLIVPARDSDGGLWGFQRIYSDKLSCGTDKIFREGARKEGCFHALGPQEGQSCFLICEGISTALSLRAALPGYTVISAFDAGNLGPVARSLRALYPQTHFTFCADDDRWPGKNGKPSYTGETAAKAAAKAVGNAHVVLPKFPPEFDEQKPTDFDDLRRLCALPTVRTQVLVTVAGGGATPPQAPQAPQAPQKTPKVSEAIIADLVLRDWGQDLIRYDKSLFQYKGTHWEELNGWETDQVKNHINRVCSSALDSKKVNSVYSTLFRLAPHMPAGVNPFVPNPLCANFLDGTLRLSRNEKSGIYCLSFREHRREDYLTWVVPVNYQCDRTIKNIRFEALLSEALSGEADQVGMRRAIQQMGGAMLIAKFSQLFFLFGLSGSRKSTIVLSLAKLLHKQNVSGVDPAEMTGFHIEGMLGKLVNIHTDIDDHIGLPRGFLKRFEDDVEIQVNRKGKPVVKAKLPAVHIYCANKLPPNFEAEGKAFQRRVTLLQFKNDLTHGGSFDSVQKHYEELVWEEGYEGLLNFCLEGLDDLVRSGGKFFNPVSSLEALQEWQLDHDLLGLFLDAVAHKELDGSNKIMLGPECEMSRATLWQFFSDWQQGPGRSRAPWDHKKLCNAMRSRGFKEKAVKGIRIWLGIGSIASWELGP